jgi:hypothetical protein
MPRSSYFEKPLLREVQKLQESFGSQFGIDAPNVVKARSNSLGGKCISARELFL